MMREKNLIFKKYLQPRKTRGPLFPLGGRKIRDRHPLDRLDVISRDLYFAALGLDRYESLVFLEDFRLHGVAILELDNVGTQGRRKQQKKNKAEERKKCLNFQIRISFRRDFISKRNGGPDFD
jgi:hypothetical protein